VLIFKGELNVGCLICQLFDVLEQNLGHFMFLVMLSGFVIWNFAQHGVQNLVI
jgi:hypothetical protein